MCRRCLPQCIFTIGTYGVNSINLGWAATVCSQSPEKKVSLPVVDDLRSRWRD